MTFVLLIHRCKRDKSSLHFFKGDAGVAIPLRIGFDSRRRAAHELLASQSRHHNQPVSRIYARPLLAVRENAQVIVFRFIRFSHQTLYTPIGCSYEFAAGCRGEWLYDVNAGNKNLLESRVWKNKRRHKEKGGSPEIPMSRV
jgi:hypothetical protein